MLKKMGGMGMALAGMELLSVTGAPSGSPVEAAMPSSKVVIASRGSIYDMVAGAVDKLGGISKFVKKGAKVALKPNTAWSELKPGDLNTHNLVLEAIIKLCKNAGAKTVTIYDHTSDDYKLTFKESGVWKVCRSMNVDIFPGDKSEYFRKISIKGAKHLKSTNVFKGILDADCYINVPVAKAHHLTTVTLAMKNQIGCVEKMGLFHQFGLHPSIAESATAIKPHLCILDATRMIMNDIEGPEIVKLENKILASTDMAALDAQGAVLFGYDPDKIEYIKLAHKLGVGQINSKKIELIRI
jgi:uncharacterized protein (DUF362 family)